MSDPTVSIITATYQHESVIAECIQSVLRQDYDRWEQVIVDDGSTDGTFEIACEFARRDPRVRVIRKPHGGIERLSDAYNLALGACRGPLVAILEGDDYWPSDKLSSQVPAHLENELLFSHGQVVMVSGQGEIGRYPNPPRMGMASSDDYLVWALTKQSYIMPVSAVISRTALSRIGGFSQDGSFPAVDYPTWLRLFQLPGQVLFVDKTLGFWRQSLTQVTKSHSVEIAERGLQLGLATVKSLAPSQQMRLGISERVVRRACFERQLSQVYLGAALDALFRCDRPAAKTYAFKLGAGQLRSKAQAVALLACAIAGVDMKRAQALYRKWGAWARASPGSAPQR